MYTLYHAAICFLFWTQSTMKIYSTKQCSIYSVQIHLSRRTLTSLSKCSVLILKYF